MLHQIAAGVHVQQSVFCQSNAVVVEGQQGVLVVDAGVLEHELVQLGADLRTRNLPVAVGFSTHPHWDHLLWHPDLGEPPRYGTEVCAGTIRARLSDPGWRDFVASMIPPDMVDQVPMDLLGQVEGLPGGTVAVPWEGPTARLVEHGAHAPGHAALLIEEPGVLVAGDMLSDVLVPLLNLNAPEPVEDYLTALAMLEDLAASAALAVPGHGSVAGGPEIRARIELDRSYVRALRERRTPDDPRIGPAAPLDWVAGVHERQRSALEA